MDHRRAVKPLGRLAAIFRQPIVEHLAAILDQTVVQCSHAVEHPGRIHDLSPHAVFVHAGQAHNRVRAGRDQLLLQLFVALHDFVDTNIFNSGEEVVCLLAVEFLHYVRHGIAIFRTQRLSPKFSRFDYVRISGNDCS